MTFSFLGYSDLNHLKDENAGRLLPALRAAHRATVTGCGGHHDDAYQKENNESPLGAYSGKAHP
ncbi:MAG: hypothetical protein VX264_08955 [Chloroflexota bacterium]|nr:hypothetical protein [Chloroflexota bacterium]|tara:strand:+ start:442 stop:633 length:192 start_codon:yes stop_codon:yes gene_type:complete